MKKIIETVNIKKHKYQVICDFCGNNIKKDQYDYFSQNNKKCDICDKDVCEYCAIIFEHTSYEDKCFFFYLCPDCVKNKLKREMMTIENLQKAYYKYTGILEGITEKLTFIGKRIKNSIRVKRSRP